MMPPPLRVHRLIEGLMGNPDAQSRYRVDPDSLFDQFEIEPALRLHLLEGTSEALGRIGVHPSMQFKFLVAIGRSPVKPSSVRYYLDRL